MGPRRRPDRPLRRRLGAGGGRRRAFPARCAAGAGATAGRDGERPRRLVGVGFRDAVWADVPSLELLDGATGGVPTALISHDLHCVWLNSAAAARYGVAVDADGLLREEPAFELTRELGHLPDAVVDAWVRESAEGSRRARDRGDCRLRDDLEPGRLAAPDRRRLRLLPGGRRGLSAGPGPGRCGGDADRPGRSPAERGCCGWVR